MAALSELRPVTEHHALRLHIPPSAKLLLLTTAGENPETVVLTGTPATEGERLTITKRLAPHFSCELSVVSFHSLCFV